MSWECPEYPKKNNGIFILDISDIQQLIYFCTSFGISAFFHSQDMYHSWNIYFGYFGHSAAHLFVHMLQKFHICSGHLPEHQGCFSFGYSRHCQDMYYSWHIYFGYFGHSAAHLFVHMLWKFCIFSGHLPEHQGCFFFWIFQTLPGHVLQLAYLFQIFRTFSI